MKTYNATPILAIEWLAARYSNPDIIIYRNPISDGWCCELGIHAAGINRCVTAESKSRAMLLAAEIVASELGWTNTREQNTDIKNHYENRQRNGG